jgi:hypothetical protein
MPHEEAGSRLQGRKTLTSPLGERPRERLLGGEKPTTNDDAARRRKRVRRTETVEYTVSSEDRNLAVPSKWSEVRLTFMIALRIIGLPLCKGA